MDKKEIARKTAALLLDTGAIHFNVQKPFVLTSGRQSPVYVDCRRPISFPQARAQLMDFAVEVLRRDCPGRDFDVIAGGETAGIAYAAWIAERLEKPMVYLRKKPKGFGRLNQVEGAFEDGAGKNALLVEDLASEGGSKALFVEILRAAGATVTDIFVIFYYDIFPSAPAAFRRLGVNLHYLATWWDVLACAREEGRFDAATLDGVEAFLKNPETWQAA